MSPLRPAYPGGTVDIVVHFAGKLNPQGTPEGNVTRVELWVNGVLVDTIQNPPNVKSGTVIFHLDLSAYGEGSIMLSAVAYQGNGKSAPSGASASKAVGVDLTDPTGTITIPSEGALLPGARPMARADYFDPAGAGGYHSGIDRSSVRLYNEHGTDVTGDAEVGDAFLLYTPAPERALADGPHELRLHVVDFAGRTFETTRHFTTDTISPGLTLETPGDGASLFAADLAFSFSASDANGVALVSATVDGTDITERFARDGDRFTYVPQAGDAVVAGLGPHTWHVVVADGAGNPTARSITYTIVENPGGGGGTPTPPLYHIHILAGDGQTGAIGRCVDGPQIPGTPETAPGVPLKVQVVDDNANGAIAGGVPLIFAGRGFVVEAPGFSTVTNSQEGVAAVRYILGRTEGDDPVTVSVLGDPTAIGVTFHENAVKPTLFTTLGMSTEPGFAGKTLLAKGGEGWVFATLTRPGDPGERPIGISASVRLEVSKLVDGMATPAAESEMYVNPRTRMTTKYGAASFILIPDVTDDADWQAKLSIPDFPELEPPPVSFRSSGTFSAGDVDHISELFATQGGITAVGHPVTLNADLTPMFTHIPPLAIALGLGFVVTHCEMTVFGAAQDELGQTLYRFGNVDGGTGAASDGKWTDGHPDPHFALTVEPNPSSVGSYPWIMTASMKVVLVNPLSGGVVTGLYHERLVVGSPEVRLDRNDGLGGIGELAGVDPAERESILPDNHIFLEVRRPIDELPRFFARMVSLDACREPVVVVNGIAPNTIEVNTTRATESARFAVYRSDLENPVVAFSEGLPTGSSPPRLPPDIQGIQVVRDGFLQPFDEAGVPERVLIVNHGGFIWPKSSESNPDDEVNAVRFPRVQGAFRYSWIITGPSGGGNKETFESNLGPQQQNAELWMSFRDAKDFSRSGLNVDAPIRVQLEENPNYRRARFRISANVYDGANPPHIIATAHLPVPLRVALRNRQILSAPDSIGDLTQSLLNDTFPDYSAPTQNDIWATSQQQHEQQLTDQLTADEVSYADVDLIADVNLTTLGLRRLVLCTGTRGSAVSQYHGTTYPYFEPDPTDTYISVRRIYGTVIFVAAGSWDLPELRAIVLHERRHAAQALEADGTHPPRTAMDQVASYPDRPPLQLLEQVYLNQRADGFGQGIARLTRSHFAEVDAQVYSLRAADSVNASYNFLGVPLVRRVGSGDHPTLIQVDSILDLLASAFRNARRDLGIMRTGRAPAEAYLNHLVDLIPEEWSDVRESLRQP